METYINARGYVIRKKAFSSNYLEELRKELYVKPFVLPELQPIMKKTLTGFKLYLENENKMYLPYFYGLSKIGIPQQDMLFLQPDRCFSSFDVFEGSMRPEQKEVVDIFLQTLDKKTRHGGILQLPCGFGKTVISIYLASRLRVKTLIVVHKEFLLNQWMERIHAFLPEVKVGIIQQKIVDIHEKQIVIAMLQSVVLKDYPDSLFQDFQFTIYDECHHLGAEIFSTILKKVTTKYMLGLSATPNRKDGLRKVFEWYLGDVLVTRERNEAVPTNQVLVQSYYFTEPEKFPHEYSTLQRSHLISFLCDSILRNNFIFDCLEQVYHESTERQILILSERKSQLESLAQKMKEHALDFGFYVGGMKQSNLKESSTKRVLLGTFQMASEGMDIPTLNTIILASPKSDVEQSVGRILRKLHTCTPKIIDINDVFYSNFNNQYQIRCKFYHKMNFSITVTTIDK